MPLVRLPRLYAILDGKATRAAGVDLLDAAQALCDAGITLLQYRDKMASAKDILQRARAIGGIFRGSGALLILNDWPDLAVQAEWDGVHVGQTDTSVADARASVGTGGLVGVSTHTVAQFRQADQTDADYIAYGPIFETLTKRDAEPAVGLHGLREVRRLSSRPLVAIGGISNRRVSNVFEAGADSIAIINALFSRGTNVRSAASHLLAITQLIEERSIGGQR